MAKKDPAFLMYSKDWLEGTAEMMPDEKGVYIDLLCHQHQKLGLPTELNRLSRLVGMAEPDFIKIWEKLKHKFVLDGDRLVNRKLSEVMTERSTKGHKNRIIGTFASLLRMADLSKKEYAEIKGEFKIDDFLAYATDEAIERLTEWFSEYTTERLHKRSKSIEDGNEDEDSNIVSRFENFEWNGYVEFKEQALQLAKSIHENCKRIQSLSQPFTPEQVCKIVANHKPEHTMDVLQSMENWKPLTTKSVSAYKTFLTWVKKREG